MPIVSALAAAKAARWRDEDGNRFDVQFLPGLSSEEIVSLEVGLGVPLPSDYCELLSECSGIEGSMYEIAFGGLHGGFGLENIVPHGLAFAGDGAGNFWVADLVSEREEETTVFFACHDPAVLLFQCRGMETFLTQLLDAHRQGEEALMRQVQNDDVFNAYSTNPGLVATSSAAESGDPKLRAFAETCEAGWTISDMRQVPAGMGFSLRRDADNIKRAGESRIFALPPKPEKKGLFGWLKR